MQRLVPFLILLTAAAASGQDAPAVRARILTYALGGLPEDFISYYKTGSEIVMFRASDGTLGVPVRYQGPREFVLRESEAAFASAEGMAKPPLASVPLPENAANVLILAAPVEGGKRVRLLAYDISPGTLGTGEYRMFNFSHATLSMVFGPRKFVIEPGRDTVVKDDEWRRKVMAFPIRIATVKDQQAKAVYSNFWEHHPGSRTLVFLFDGNRPNQAIRFMDFTVDVPADDAAAGL